MARLEQNQQKEMDPKFLSVIFDKDYQKQRLEEKERSKVELFERGLAGEISTFDTIEKTVEKIVKMALTCEFGAGLVAKSGAKRMISTISRGILSDSSLRRSALIIADRFATSGKTRTVALRGKRKTIING
jgi:adenosylcobinamide amidohydrolase